MNGVVRYWSETWFISAKELLAGCTNRLEQLGVTHVCVCTSENIFSLHQVACSWHQSQKTLRPLFFVKLHFSQVNYFCEVFSALVCQIVQCVQVLYFIFLQELQRFTVQFKIKVHALGHIEEYICWDVGCALCVNFETQSKKIFQLHFIHFYLNSYERIKDQFVTVGCFECKAFRIIYRKVFSYLGCDYRLLYTAFSSFFGV